MDLVVVRHSISVSNTADLISGQSNDVPLSDQGIVYAQQVRAAYDWDRFDAVYASPMIRTRQTAAILTNDRADVQFDPRLMEMDFGDWDGTSADPIRIEHPDAFDYSGMFNGNFSKYAPNAESYVDLLQRSNAFLKDIEGKHPKDAVLVVAHGLTIRALFAAATLSDVYSFTAVHNVALSELHLDHKDNFRARIMHFNERLV
jgi:probable phosphoglycerate mutase